MLDWMGVRGKITALAVGAVVASTGVPAAAVAEPGLTVDPQSPAGVEYAVPLDTGRGHGGGGSIHPGGGSGGSGGGSTSGGSAGGSPSGLFGSGITPPKSSGSGSGQRPRAHVRSHSGGGGGGGKGAGKPSGQGSGASAGQVVAPVEASASYSATGPVAGVIGAVLLLGGGVGVFLRLRARRTPVS